MADHPKMNPEWVIVSFAGRWLPIFFQTETDAKLFIVRRCGEIIDQAEGLDKNETVALTFNTVGEIVSALGRMNNAGGDDAKGAQALAQEFLAMVQMMFKRGQFWRAQDDW